MSNARTDASLARRSFLSRIGAGAAAFGVAVSGREGGAQTATPVQSSFAPAAHAEDDWFDQVPATTKHRVFYDTTRAGSFGQALFFARNSFVANANGYNNADTNGHSDGDSNCNSDCYADADAGECLYAGD